MGIFKTHSLPCLTTAQLRSSASRTMELECDINRMLAIFSSMINSCRGGPASGAVIPLPTWAYVKMGTEGCLCYFTPGVSSPSRSAERGQRQDPSLELVRQRVW